MANDRTGIHDVHTIAFAHPNAQLTKRMRVLHFEQPLASQRSDATCELTWLQANR